MNAPPKTIDAPYDVEAIRRDFPILSREVYGKPLVYLDNGASAQKPQAVIDAITARLHGRIRQRPPRPALPVERRDRGLRGGARDRARLLNAAHLDEIIFTRNATEAINLVAAYGSA
jgi:cysteine desulfurase / selenocysteine lyase